MAGHFLMAAMAPQGGRGKREREKRSSGMGQEGGKSFPYRGGGGGGGKKCLFGGRYKAMDRDKSLLPLRIKKTNRKETQTSTS